MKLNVNKTIDSSGGDGDACESESGSGASSSTSGRTADSKPAAKPTAKSGTAPIKYAFGAPTPSGSKKWNRRRRAGWCIRRRSCPSRHSTASTSNSRSKRQTHAYTSWRLKCEALPSLSLRCLNEYGGAVCLVSSAVAMKCNFIE